MCPRGIINNEKGFVTVLTLLCGLVINLGIQFVSINQVLQLRKIALKNDLMATEQQLINEMDTLVYFKGSIVEDAIKHSQLKSCIEKSGNEDCNGQGIEVTDLSITLPDGHVLVKNGIQCVSSIGSTCACNSDGKISYHCPFKKTVKISPLCRGNEPTCDIAEGLFFSFEVEIQEDIKKEYGLSKIKKDLYISDIAEEDGLSTICLPGKNVIGFNPDGSVECRAIFKDIYIRHFHFISLGIGSFWPLKTLAERLVKKAIKMVIDKLKAMLLAEIQEKVMEKVVKALDLKMNGVWAKLLNQFAGRQLGKHLPKLLPDSVREGFSALDEEVRKFTKEAVEARLADNDWGTKLKHELDGAMNTIGSVTQEFTENLVKSIGLDNLGQEVLNAELLAGNNKLQKEISKQIKTYLTAGGIGEQVRKELLKKVREKTIIQDDKNVYYKDGKFSFTF